MFLCSHNLQVLTMCLVRIVERNVNRHEHPWCLLSIQRFKLSDQPLVLSRIGFHGRVGADTDMLGWSIVKGIISISPFIRQGIWCIIHIQVAIVDKFAQSSATGLRHLETIFIRLKNRSITSLFNVMISGGDLQGRGMEDGKVIQKVEKGIPSSMIFIGVGNISHQHYSIHSIRIVQHVLQSAFRMRELSQISHDTKSKWFIS
mmetsp:Transcript_81363/g.235973  ORF Transcript_81363/g.235973 Transcript_81363/m.235973 type:complete len:203 (+) Transcript_81363:156-764(+)